MNETSRRWLLWTPRILAILVCLFLGLFALDVFGGGKALSDAIPEFAVHVIPTLVLLAVVALSWRWEWIGGWVFIGLSLAYAFVARDHVTWVLCISVPLFVVGVLYRWNWRHHRELHARA
jgi:hypothetical protein